MFEINIKSLTHDFAHLQLNVTLIERDKQYMIRNKKNKFTDTF